MEIIIALVIVLLGVAFFVDSARKRSQDREKTVAPERLLSANEAPPTETGRLRVKHIVDTLKKPQEAGKPAAESDQSVPDGAGQTLPDPFDADSKK